MTQRYFTVVKILELKEGVECIVVGTLYKEMRLKPSILDEYVKERGLAPALSSSKFVSDDDSLVIEDEAARVKLRVEDASVLKVTDVVSVSHFKSISISNNST